MLAKALESIAQSVMPESVQWEVLVVDNNSRDRTREVAEGFCARFPGRFRYLFEARQGKSHALNSAIRAAQGEVLAFTDDDVTVELTWLQNLTACLIAGTSIGCGGRIFPERHFAAPAWLPQDERYAKAPLVMFDLGPDAGDLLEAPYGANMAFVKEVFSKYGDFRVDLGPQPGSEIRSEDSEFCNRLLAAGEMLRYEPSAVVYHEVPSNRLRKEYFLAWWFDKARGDIRASGLPFDAKWHVAGVPVVLFRRLTVWTIRWIFTIHPARRFARKLQVWTIAGQIGELYSGGSAARVASA
jgi:glycosyltransferase involved in cell wall biosynthesis